MSCSAARATPERAARETAPHTPRDRERNTHAHTRTLPPTHTLTRTQQNSGRSGHHVDGAPLPTPERTARETALLAHGRVRPHTGRSALPFCLWVGGYGRDREGDVHRTVVGRGGGSSGAYCRTGEGVRMFVCVCVRVCARARVRVCVFMPSGTCVVLFMLSVAWRLAGRCYGCRPVALVYMYERSSSFSSLSCGHQRQQSNNSTAQHCTHTHTHPHLHTHTHTYTGAGECAEGSAPSPPPAHPTGPSLPPRLAELLRRAVQLPQAKGESRVCVFICLCVLVCVRA